MSCYVRVPTDLVPNNKELVNSYAAHQPRVEPPKRCGRTTRTMHGLLYHFPRESQVSKAKNTLFAHLTIPFEGIGSLQDLIQGPSLPAAETPSTGWGRFLPTGKYSNQELLRD
jgi:hypothetical protein